MLPFYFLPYRMATFLLLPCSPLKSQVPFTATLDALKSINPHVKYLESWYKVRRTAHS